jgi:cation diffusion facilitator family transporter
MPRLAFALRPLVAPMPCGQSPGRFAMSGMSIDRVGALTVVVATFVLLLKAGAWWLTGSVALFADTLESTVNVASGMLTLVALRYAARPADHDHPYGHAKAEYFAAIAVGALIIVAAMLILHQAYGALLDPQAPDHIGPGLTLAAVAMVANAGWGAVLVRRGRAGGYPAMVAEGRHLFADVLTTAAVLAGVALVAATGLLWLDPLVAILTAFAILWSGWQVIRGSVGALMDEAASPDTVRQLQRVIAAHASGAIEAHDLRCRQAGPTVFAELHLVVPGDMSVAAAHAICDRIEEAVRAAIGQAVITIHVEPESKAKLRGVPVA